MIIIVSVSVEEMQPEWVDFLHQTRMDVHQLTLI